MGEHEDDVTVVVTDLSPTVSEVTVKNSKGESVVFRVPGSPIVDRDPMGYRPARSS